MMKRELLVCVVAVLCLAVPIGCSSVRQQMNEAGATEISDLLGKYQARTYETALKNAAATRARVVEERGAKLVQFVEDGVEGKPWPRRVLRGYDEWVTSIDSDVLLIQELKDEADKVGKPVVQGDPVPAAPVLEAVPVAPARYTNRVLGQDRLKAELRTGPALRAATS